LLFQQLADSKDQQIAAITVKSLKEITYHLRWSSEWVIRLGDGTKESHKRIVKAIDELWMYTGELFEASSYELPVVSEGIAADVSKLKEPWMNKVKEIFTEATLTVPENISMQSGGKEGKHSEDLDNILKDMQYMQRTYPNCEW
jgi:ring-1,2-phenylacetyl-CoA epoxidase subunit PaaC